MSVFDVIREQQNRIKRKVGENDTELAKRLYCVHIEVMSSYAGRDLYRDFDDLDKKTREGWVEKAKGWRA